MEDMYLAAFWDLSTERSHSGVHAVVIPWEIPWHHVRDYGRDHLGLDPALNKCFIFVIRQMDNAFLRWEAARLKKLLKHGGSNGPRYDRGEGPET